MKNKFFIVGNEVYIKLPQNNYPEALWTIIDLEDLPKVMAYSGCWRVKRDPKTYYVVMRRRNGNLHWRMHNIIMNNKTLNEVNHINGHGFDNVKDNLIILSHIDNTRNRTRLNINNSSGVSGVYYNSNSRSWIAQIKINYENIYLGSFSKKEYAIKARMEAENKYMEKVKI